MKKTAITLALSAALALSACGIPASGSAEDSPTSGSNRPDVSASESTDPTGADADSAAAPDPSDLPEGASEGMPVLSFGEAFAYVDGIQVTVGKPTPMTSGEWASPADTKGSAFTVTIVNDSEAPFDPSMAYLSVQSGNTESEEIFDSEAGFVGAPDTTLLPGREATFDVAFAMSDPSDVVVEISPSWEHDAALYATDEAN